jgi:4-hydroxy-tetrahydrodipicolinate reductase
MGRETVAAVEREEGLALAGAIDLGDDLSGSIKDLNADVVVDFTAPQAVFDNACTIINAGAHPVIGTTGLADAQINELQALAAKKRLGGLIAPNFAIGAVLMMKYAADAVRYLPHVEIIELHHDKKADAPSGTAVKTAALLKANRPTRPEPLKERESVAGARGGDYDGIRVHSVRLPGFVAHQEVIFGGLGQTLTIRHDSSSRESFMPGVCLACKKVVGLQQLVYGLEHLL